MTYSQSASELETMLPFQDATKQVSMLTSVLSSLDFSTLPADKTSIKALTLTYETKGQDIESVYQKNAVVLQQLFEKITSKLDDSTLKDVVMLPLNAFVSVKNYEKVLYTRIPLSGVYSAMCEMVEVIANISLVKLTQTRENVVALIFGNLFATKLIASPLLKPYSVLAAVASSTSFAQRMLQDNLDSLLAQIDSFYEYALKYKHVLYEKKRQLTDVSEYGFMDDSRWDTEKLRFATALVKRHLRKDFYDASVEATMVQFVAEYIVGSVVNDETSNPIEGQNSSPVNNAGKGIDFERRCIDLLSENGWSATPTPKTGDMGVDIIATKRGLRVAVQCKCWEGKIGSTAVQEVYTGSQFYDADAAVILGETPLTAQAAEIARKLRVVVATAEDIPTLEVATSPRF